MNGTTILLWITIFIIGAIAIIAVKLRFKGNELENDEESIISKETIDGILSYGQKKPSDETDISPNNNAQPNLDYAVDNGYEVLQEVEIDDTGYQNIEYESQNQVLINYENKIKKIQDPMNETQIDIMTPNNDQNNEKHELKDLFTIDELIKESKRKDSEREKESQKIEKEAEDTTEIKESIKRKQENDDIEEKLIEEILADEEIGEILNGADIAPEPIEEEPKEETIQDIINQAESKEEIEDVKETETVPEIAETEETIPDIAETEEPKEETIQNIIETEEPKEETIQEVLDVEEPEENISQATEKAEFPETTTQKDIAEAINNASQEIEEEKIESISESDGITDVLLNTEEEIKQPTLKSPTKIQTDESNLSDESEVNDLDYRKDLAKITNTIKGSRIFQDVKERLKPQPEEEIDPIADLEETYIRNVTEYEDEYEPIINETHDEFGQNYEPDYEYEYDQAIREENTRKLFDNVPITPEIEIAEPKKEVIKSKPARNNIKIELNNVEHVLKKGDEIIFNHDGETYSSQVYAIHGDDISVRYRRKDIVIKPEDIKKIY